MDIQAFLSMVSMMDGGGDFGKMVPESDGADFAKGARYIPGEVTMARRRGETVIFNPHAHQWIMPNGDVLGSNVDD